MNDDGTFGESLLSLIGVAPFLKREHPFVTKALHAQAERLPKLIRSEIRSFLDDAPPEKLPKPAPFDYMALLDQVSKPVDQHDLEQLIDSHQEPTDAIQVLFPLTRAIGYLAGVIPRRSKQTLTGVTQLKPSDQEIGRFQRAFVVVNSPMSVFTKLRRLALMPDEVTALVSVYPALYQAIGSIVGEELAAALVRKGTKWKPPHAQEAQLMLLLQMATADPDLVKSLQTTFGEQPTDNESPQSSGGAAAKVNFKAGAFATKAQQAEGAGR